METTLRRLFFCTTLPTVLAASSFAHAMATPAGEWVTNAHAVHQAPATPAQEESVELKRVLERIALNDEVTLYRLQVAANEGSAQPPRVDNVKAVVGQSGAIAVLYPDLGEPYRSIFAKIVEGIEAQLGTRVVSYAVGAALSAHDILTQIKGKNIKTVIALGRQGVKAASALEHDVGVVVGGVMSAPQSDGRNFPVVSLAPDPGMLFERLKHFMPGVRRVTVVYDPRQSAWLIALAQEAARKQGLELQAIEASDLKTAVREYQEHLADADPKKEAFWLPQDSTTVEDSTVLPLVLESAWNRSLTVFSSNVAHVKRGALFSLYPNNLALGRQLAASALNYPTDKLQSPTVAPLKDAFLAVNVRTASHLGLQLSPLQQSFDLVFPAQ